MLTELDAKGWELYNVDEDPAETKNLAEKERSRLIAMIGMWYAEAGKYNVLPIDSRGMQRIAEERPQIAVNRSRYVLYPGYAIDPGIGGAENPQSPVLDHGRGRRARRRSGRRAAEHGRKRRRHLAVRPERKALLRA